ncbi:TNR6C protein, partial [Atractosteus spatula]|nr:TNR6C protein [Atractosteus spatula]
VPESAKPSSSAPHPANPSAPPSVPAVSTSGNGKRAPPSVQQQQQQQQQQQPAALRYPPREVPPRFRQHEHKQLLKRGQPLPAGTLPLSTGPPGADLPPQTAGKQHAELPHQSGLGAQYENPHWGPQPTSRSEANSSSWDQVIIDERDTEAWPSISRGDSHAPPECTTDTDCATEISSSSSSSSMSMATGGGQQGHFPAHHPSSKTSANHSGNMVSGQGGASRGWGSGPAHCPSTIGGDGKTDNLPVGGRGQPCWGSSNFNLNLNPNANPAAWPVLGHEGNGMGGSGPGGNNPPPTPNLCSPAGAPPVQGNSGGGNMGSANGNLAGGNGSNAWGSLLPPDATEPRSSPSTNVSFSVEPQNLNTDGPNNTKQEPLSPIHGLPSWGTVPVGMGSLVQPPTGASQVNGEGGSVWGNGDAKSAGSKDSAWDSGPTSGPGLLSAWGRAGNGGGGGAGGTGAWGRSAGGDWGKHSSEAKGWESTGTPPQEQLSSWTRTANAPASEGSNDSLEGRSRRRERSSSEQEPAPPLPRQDLDPRVLCNTGWGQTPVRQHTVWEIEEPPRPDRKNDNGTEAWGSSSAAPSSAGPQLASGGANANPSAAQMSNSAGKGEGSSSSSSAASGWGNPSPVLVTPAPGPPGSGWGEQPGSKKAPNGSGGWGDPSPSGPSANPPKGGLSWGPEEKSPSWDDPPAKAKPHSWGEGPKPSHGWGGGAPSGWGELPSVHSKSEPSWGEPTSPSPAVDNGTSAWGKPPSGCGGWGDSSPDPAGHYSRGSIPPGSAPCKPASKSMQDGWGGSADELSLSAGQWEQEEGDMWNSAASQESNSSCSSWGNAPKKGQQKAMKALNKQDDVWLMSRLIKQLTDMGFPRDPAEEALKSSNMNLDQAMSALLEKKTELDKRGMGISDYNNGMVTKPLGCRPPTISKESSSDRPSFLDKDGSLVEDAPTSPFLPSPSLKLPLSSSALPTQALGGVSTGLAMQNLNSNRQVQAQLLQFAAKNIGLNPALLTSPMNPQHMTLLNQLYQLQLVSSWRPELQAYQRLQIQQQMLQAQRNVSGPIRQQEQQVARTINNMQQQIQQHQRQLAQALLMKQQQQPPPHPGLHPGAGKSALDSFPPHPQAPGLADLQTKEQQSSPNSYSPYPLAGLNPNMNVSSIDVSGGLSMKDTSQSQSRLPQWTHPNSMENLSGNSSPLEPNLSKHGAIPAGPSIGPPGKPPMEDSYSPYNLIPSSESPASPLVAPDSWTQGKASNDKISNGTNINWPPEFCPGVPWKGLQNIDPETDPNVTPGSVPSGPTINTNIQDVNRYLLRDRSGGSSPTSSQNGALPSSDAWPVSAYTSSFSLSPSATDSAGKLSDMKSTWSPGPISHTQASLSHELWKVPQGPRNTTAPTRPPPGLTNTKLSSTWSGSALGLVPGWSSSYSSGTTWSTDSSGRTSSWLVLRNLTPQIDGSTLRTLCMQHGPLITFHLNLTQGNAVVRYSSKEEAAKAQKSLHMCVLGNTTILAEFAGEEEVNRFFAQGQSLTPTTSWQANPGTNQTRLGSSGASHAMGHWNSSGLGGGKASSDLLWGAVPQYSSLWGPPGGEDARVIGSPTPINTLLPGDLLSGESM